MVGTNKQDGGILIGTETALLLKMLRNGDISDGIDMAFTEQYLKMRCPAWFTPLSPSLCASFIINKYGLDEAENDRDRTRRLLEFFGKMFQGSVIALTALLTIAL